MEQHNEIPAELVIHCHTIHAVTLSAAGNSPTFRGFFIQGRLAADDSPGVGTFVNPPPGSVTRLSSCSTPSVRERTLLGRPRPIAPLDILGFPSLHVHGHLIHAYVE